MLGRVVVGHVAHEHGELVATDAGEVVAHPERGAEPVGHLDQHLVAHVVAVGIVDGFEGIEVAERHGQVTLADGQRLGQPFAEVRPVGHAREPVVAGDVHEALVLDPLLDGELHVAGLQFEAHLVAEQRRAGV